MSARSTILTWCKSEILESPTCNSAALQEWLHVFIVCVCVLVTSSRPSHRATQNEGRKKGSVQAPDRKAIPCNAKICTKIKPRAMSKASSGHSSGCCRLLLEQTCLGLAQIKIKTTREFTKSKVTTSAQHALGLLLFVADRPSQQETGAGGGREDHEQIDHGIRCDTLTLVEEAQGEDDGG